MGQQISVRYLPDRPAVSRAEGCTPVGKAVYLKALAMFSAFFCIGAIALARDIKKYAPAVRAG